jgi:hypothetical protein
VGDVMSGKADPIVTPTPVPDETAALETAETQDAVGNNHPGNGNGNGNKPDTPPGQDKDKGNKDKDKGNNGNGKGKNK